MSQVDAETSHWAILIGVNFHKEKPLKGCVRDVELMKHCLENYLNTGRKSLRIVTLTATTPDNPGSSHPTERPDSWPTYENVIFNLEIITAQAKPGDFIYIHYSGHGTQAKGPPKGSNSHENTEGLALVLFDLPKGSRYLLGSDLANRLNDMVRKGLLVTLVLDCCFSGSVIRHSSLHDASIRTIPYDPEIDAAYPQEAGSFPSDHVKSALRDARTLPEWLIDPDGYTILSACGPYEEAEELTIKSGKAAGEKNGALTFFLAFALHSLWKSGIQITHQSLYQHLCVQFHINWPKQTPMRYGNKSLSFFGKPKPSLDTAFIPVFKTNQHNRLQLGAGHAHGVCKGDEFAIYPFDSPDDASIDTRNDPLKFTVDTVRPLTSDLVGIEPISNLYETRPGWKARLLTKLSSQKVPVRLLPTISDQIQWILATEHRRFLTLSTEDMEEQPCIFNVTLNERDEYQILNESYQSITSLPAIPSNRQEALHHVVDILEHLATFKYFEGIDNRIPNVLFEESFELRLADTDAQDLTESGTVDVKEEDVLCLSIENRGDHPLYVAVFDLGPEWQIDSLLSQGGGGGFRVVPPKMGGCSGKEEIEWRMSIPESFKRHGEHRCNDVLKVFVTSRASWFAPMLLPTVPISGKGSDRSFLGNYDRLSVFLSGLTKSSRGEYDFPNGAWAVRNFLICTSMK